MLKPLELLRIFQAAAEASSFREAAAAFKAKHGCASCNHANSAHGPSGSTVAQDKIGGGRGRCGCAARMGRRAA